MSEIIEQGVLRDIPYHVKKLKVDDLPQILDLQRTVVDALPHKDILEPLSAEEFEYILKGNGIVIGVFVGDRLIAFRALLIPEIDDQHLGKDIGLNEEDLKRVIYQEISNVHPEFRGYGLQKKMAKIIMKLIDDSEFDYVMATVMPYNIPSIKDKLHQGMHIAALKEKYGGKLRYIFVKPLRKKLKLKKEAVLIPMGDIEGQKNLLHNGYIGVAIKHQCDDWYVEYRKVEAEDLG
ncbi:GNAT family N-acetyltransferase [Ureibacillus sp. FSL K6-8385]|uniref:GNAT family N-acetyltransferase n=1 Tax=Ureibacillus sp. FSL K6-8385 TaxID=2954684 RepID=UPI00315807B1